MKKFERHFFLTLIQLTLLATVFRENTYRLINTFNNNININNNNYNFKSDLTYLNKHLINDQGLYISTNSFSESQQPVEFLTPNYFLHRSNYIDNNRIKETQLILNDLILLRQLGTRSIENTNNYLIVAPASFIANNQNEILQRSETRYLIHSIELTANTISKDLEMEIDIQAILEQDFDLGYKPSYANLDLNGQSSNEISPSSYEYKLDQSKSLDVRVFKDQFESQKNENISMLTNLLQNSNPDGYKIIVEEDTGEVIFLFTNNDDEDGANRTNQTNQNLDTYEKNNSPELLNYTNLNDSQESNGSNQSVSLVADSNQSFAEYSNDQDTPDSAQLNQNEFVKPVFLSQQSVSTELNKICSTNSNINNQSAPFAAQVTAATVITNNSTNLEDVMSNSFDLLNEVFINETLINDYLSQSQGMVQEIGTSTANTNNTNKIYVEQSSIQVPNNQSLLNINKNQSVLLEKNDTLISMGKADGPTDAFNSTNGMFESLIDDQAKLDSVYFDDNFFSKLELLPEKSVTSQDINTNNEFNMIFQSNSLNQQNANSSSYAQQQQQQQQANNYDFAFSKSNSYEREALNSLHINNKIIMRNDDKAKNKNYNYSSTLYDITLSVKQEPNEHQLDDVILESSSKAPFVPPDRNRNLALEGFMHNHTYAGSHKTKEDLEKLEIQHPYSYKNKLKKMLKNLQDNLSNDSLSRQQESKDELSLRENNIDLSLKIIIESSADEFNEIIKNTSYDIEQISLIKDIRRRGKNKIAAQTCRKRKIDSIEHLEREVARLREMKSRMQSEYNSVNDQIKQMSVKFDNLYKETAAYNSNAMTLFVKNQMSKPVSTLNMQQKDKLRTNSLESRNEDEAYNSTGSSPNEFTITSSTGNMDLNDESSIISNDDEYDEEEEEVEENDNESELESDMDDDDERDDDGADDKQTKMNLKQSNKNKKLKKY